MKKRIFINNKLTKKKMYSKKTRVLGLNVPLFMAPIFVVLIVASVFIMIDVATSGSKLAKLEKEKASLSRENGEIKEKLIGDSSLTELSNKAEDLGFAKPQSVIYVTDIDTLAKLP